MGRVLIVLAFLSLAVAVMGSERNGGNSLKLVLGRFLEANVIENENCSQSTVCKYGTHCCSPVTCCPDYSYCCGTGHQCCRLANSLLAPEKFPATEAVVV